MVGDGSAMVGEYHMERGEDPFEVAMPGAPHEEVLRDGWRMLRFVTWLVDGKEPSIEPETAAEMLAL